MRHSENYLKSEIEKSPPLKIDGRQGRHIESIRFGTSHYRSVSAIPAAGWRSDRNPRKPIERTARPAAGEPPSPGGFRAFFAAFKGGLLKRPTRDEFLTQTRPFAESARRRSVAGRVLGSYRMSKWTEPGWPACTGWQAASGTWRFVDEGYARTKTPDPILFGTEFAPGHPG